MDSGPWNRQGGRGHWGTESRETELASLFPPSSLAKLWVQEVKLFWKRNRCRFGIKVFLFCQVRGKHSVPVALTSNSCFVTSQYKSHSNKRNRTCFCSKSLPPIVESVDRFYPESQCS